MDRALWPEERAAQLERRLSTLRQKPSLRFSFVPSHETGHLRYFPQNLVADLSPLAARGFVYQPPLEGIGDCDVIIVTAHGLDISSLMWDLRRAAPDALLMPWLWDNHTAQVNNLKTALASDILFPSHWYAAEYLINPVSLLAVHIPLCAAQWTIEEAHAVYRAHEGRPRRDKLLVNYVDYEFSWRSELLRRLKKEVTQAEVLLMPPGDRSRYFNKSPADRLAEWLGYKATLILPLDKDLSTRVFDALVAGQVMVVPDMVIDFDAVLKPELQRALGVVKVPDVKMKTIRDAAAQAIAIWNQTGEAGARMRHDHALSNHMLVHRIARMLQTLRQPLTPIFQQSRERSSGLLYKVPTAVAPTPA